MFDRDLPLTPALPRLSNATLERLPPQIRRPAYDRAAVTPGIVHLGVGAFHRAHQAAYVDDVLGSGDRGWGIVAASLRSPETRDALGPQDGLYALAVRSAETETLRVVGAIQRVLVAPENPAALLAAMADARTRIVTLTITEKGYCHDPATGELNEDHPDIRADLAKPRSPRSAIGFLAEALRLRRAAGTLPFTVLTCDNLPANGHTVRRVVARHASMLDADFGAFVSGEVAFPSTMVDRIVPATTQADRDRVSHGLGLTDAWPVITEPFSQWVIEDRFTLGRPGLEACGAVLVADVAPYETMKLRLLNGSHSTLAYLGYLAGHETIAAAMADAPFAALVANLMDQETGPTLSLPAGVDVESYKRSLIERFRNKALRHRTWQIAMDGSQKLPQRLLAAARERIAEAAPIPRIALGVAAWMRYVTGIDEKDAPIDVRDPLAERLRALSDTAGRDAERLSGALLGVREVFGDDLARNERFAAPVTTALSLLLRAGAKEAVRLTA
ncbi:MAG: mannitol dehydrogenase family protein [Hyphomicrobiales bacterium]